MVLLISVEFDESPVACVSSHNYYQRVAIIVLARVLARFPADVWPCRSAGKNLAIIAFIPTTSCSGPGLIAKVNEAILNAVPLGALPSMSDIQYNRKAITP